MFTITAAVENTVAMPLRPGIIPGLLGEHGLALLIESSSGLWLYDTGRGKALLPNLKTLGVSPDSVDGVILSHGHLDHFGSLKQLLEARTRPLEVYGHPDCFARRYTRIGGKGGAAGGEGLPRSQGQAPAAEELRPAGMPWSPEELERLGARLHLSREPVWLGPDLLITGEIPRRFGFERVGEGFLVERQSGLMKDELLDDQALVLLGREGFLALTGCAHAGICNILERGAELCGQPVFGAAGGLHLLNAPKERLLGTLAYFREKRPRLLACCHCTGFPETLELACAFPGVFRSLNAGECIEFA